MQKTRAIGLRVGKVEKNKWMKGGLWYFSCGAADQPQARVATFVPAGILLSDGWWREGKEHGAGGCEGAKIPSTGHGNKAMEIIFFRLLVTLWIPDTQKPGRGGVLHVQRKGRGRTLKIKIIIL